MHNNVAENSFKMLKQLKRDKNKHESPAVAREDARQPIQFMLQH